MFWRDIVGQILFLFAQKLLKIINMLKNRVKT